MFSLINIIVFCKYKHIWYWWLQQSPKKLGQRQNKRLPKLNSPQLAGEMVIGEGIVFGYTFLQATMDHGSPLCVKFNYFFLISFKNHISKKTAKDLILSPPTIILRKDSGNPDKSQSVCKAGNFCWICLSFELSDGIAWETIMLVC